MIQKDLKDIIKYLRSLYGDSFQGLSSDDWWEVLKKWEKGIGRESYKSVKAAINSHRNKGRKEPPTLMDIYKELMNIDEDKYREMFDSLVRQARLATNPEKHITILDIGGLKWSDEYGRMIYYHPEAKEGVEYLPQDFTSMPKELQVYAEDINGLKAIHREIESNKDLAYKRFKARIPEIKEMLYGQDEQREGQKGRETRGKDSARAWL